MQKGPPIQYPTTEKSKMQIISKAKFWFPG